jgi:site-specific DNA recombinase
VRLLLAARLSQDHSGQTGLDTQDADARSWAERNGHDVIATAADKISGRVSPFDRPNLGPWLSDPMKMRVYDGVIVPS